MHRADIGLVAVFGESMNYIMNVRISKATERLTSFDKDSAPSLTQPLARQVKDQTETAGLKQDVGRTAQQQGARLIS